MGRLVPRDAIKAPAQPLRSEKHIFGFPNLVHKHKARVRISNMATLFTIKVMRKVSENGGAVVLQNPENSLLWKIPQLAKLSREFGWSFTKYHACCFGGARAKKQMLLTNFSRQVI